MNLITAESSLSRRPSVIIIALSPKQMTHESGDESEDLVDDDHDRDLLLFLNLMCESEEASEQLSATESSEEDSSEDAT